MNPLYRFEGRHALVTGATKGIGLATATLLAQAGARVIVHGSSAGSCVEAIKSVPGGIPLPCDLNDASQREIFCRQVMHALDGSLDFLIHNAGIFPQGDIESQGLDEFRRVFSINVESQYHLTQLLLPALRKAGSASIVLVSSVVTRMGRGDSPAYTMSKAAQIGLTRHLAAELGPYHIRVNCVLPGLVDTPGTRAVRQDAESYTQFARSRQMLPLPIQPIDLAHPIAFLCSDGARAMTAATIDVNAGVCVGG